MTDETAPQNLTQASQEKLRQTIDRIETLEEEKAAVSEQIRDVYAEAKALGFDTKAIRQVVKLRKLDKQARAEMEMILVLYLQALGEI